MAGSSEFLALREISAVHGVGWNVRWVGFISCRSTWNWREPPSQSLLRWSFARKGMGGFRYVTEMSILLLSEPHGAYYALSIYDAKSLLVNAGPRRRRGETRLNLPYSWECGWIRRNPLWKQLLCIFCRMRTLRPSSCWDWMRKQCSWIGSEA